MKYKDVVSYLFFGICTTGINVVSYWILAHPMRVSLMESTVLAWLLAVLFAYITNRKWVFCSKAAGKLEIAKEAATFFGCRLLTGVMDWLGMWIFADLMKLNDVAVKFAANVAVIVLNYLAGKLVIFRDRRKL